MKSDVMASDYFQKLKHPKWQKKRLEIMERDGFTCRSCQAKDTTLNVHHLYYISGRDPWAYPNSAFQTLCENCHDAIRHDPTMFDVNKVVFPFEFILEVFGCDGGYEFTKALLHRANLNGQEMPELLRVVTLMLNDPSFIEEAWKQVREMATP